MSEWDKKHPEKCREYDIQRRLRNPIRALIRGAKQRAAAKGLEFNLEQKDFEPNPEYCPVFGTKLIYGRRGRQQPDSPSLDRFDNSKGYTKDNVRVISLRANTLKADGRLEEMEKIVEYMRSRIV